MEVIAVAAIAVLFAAFGVVMLVKSKVGAVEQEARVAFQKLRVLYGTKVESQGEDDEGNPLTVVNYELSPEGEAVIAEFEK